MKIVVCIKQVPSTEARVQMDPIKGTLIREGVESVVNPFDEYAIEEGIRLKERYGGEVTVISMGPPQAKEALKTALAMGADKAVLLSDRAFAGSDTLATAYTLSLGIKKLGDIDIVICGKQATDGDTAQVGPGLAQRLNLRQITYVSKIREINLKNRKITAERLIESGTQVVSTALPALITVVKDINQPRIPNIFSIKKATRAEIPVWGMQDLGGDPKDFGFDGSPTQVVRIFTPPPRQGGEIIQGEVPEAVAKLIEALTSRNIINL
ncbi:electron transfer flavoprotein subunit beta/FixA family protein [Biomaibacter acetigenes]|uniref:Electron transfer flavoprotein small subunit n=1 Tax=Biomaibacter acetigenes TaxID=2316383 RepID=A0A3G2R2L3_9FIRM|nr:electron transfer flavoprotein subunit beta/FixA family protein [Biomaibacter acetigenes]AYO29589.1 electron transfer flavoprotein subunit beta/FixA family protein [Biomaibacter acetigenes]